MKIGLYLAYPPYIKALSLKQEGLGRYLSFLIKAFIKNGCSVTVACPRWMLDSLDELIEEENIDRNRIEFIAPKAEPILYKIYLNRVNKLSKIRRRRKGGIKQATLNFADSIVSTLLYTKSIFIFFLIMLAGILFSLVLLPFVIILGLLYACTKLLKKVFAKILKSEIENTDLKTNLKKYVKKSRILTSLALHIISVFSTAKIKERIRLSAAEEIIRRIKYMIDGPDVWYSPMAFWSEFNNIKGTKVICAPDLVSTEFATSFSVNLFSEATNDVRKTIDMGKYFITYCDYLKNTLLVNKFSKRPENIRAIPHAVNQTLDFINIEKNYTAKTFDYDINRYFARNRVLCDIYNNSIDMKKYLTGYKNNFSFKDVRYIFYASQVRPNKNLLSLIKAYEYLLRDKYIFVKLFLTCDINLNKSVRDYVYEKRLQYDVLCFHGVNNQQLSALYMCADLVANPTLYEGGFPFTFGEGMSVGTPSVMSKIQQVTEVTDGYNLNEFLFDPYDYIDIANKIQYGLEHRDELVKRETPLFQELSRRTWDDVGREYIQAFKYFIDKNSREQVK